MNKRRMALAWALIYIIANVALGVTVKYFFNTYPIDPLCYSLQVSIVACLLFFIIAVCKDGLNQVRLKKKHFILLAMVGLLGVGLNYGLFYTGLQNTLMINASFLGSTSIVFAVLLAHFFLKERLTALKIVFIIFILAGAYLVSTAGKTLVPQSGDILIVASSVASAGAYVLARRALDFAGTITISLYRSLFGAVFLAPCVFIAGRPHLWLSWGSALIVGVLIVICVYSMFKILDYASVSYSAIMATPAIILTVIAASIFLGERINMIQAMGGGIILISAYFAGRSDI